MAYDRDFQARREAADRLTEAYLDAVDMDNQPAPAETAMGLLAFLADGFKAHNASVPKEAQWDIPVELDARQTAALVLKFHDIRLLPWPAGTDTAREYYRLHVYQTHGMDAGLYTTDILSVSEAFVPEIDLFTEQDVEAILRDCAEVRERRNPA